MGYDKMYISNDEFIVDAENVGDISIGRKYDGNKLEYGLLPPLALEATVDVLYEHDILYSVDEQINYGVEK